MSTDACHCYARITPLPPEHAGRVLNTWNLLWNTVACQSLGMLYGFSCCMLPMLAGVMVGGVIGRSVDAALAVGTVLGLGGAGLALIGLIFFGFPVLLFETRICRRFLRTVDVLSNPIISPFAADVRVVELVPRQRRRKWLSLDTATDLMLIRVDTSGVWMKGDYHAYEFPAESIVGAHCESYRPSGWSIRLFPVTVTVRTASDTIELPISYRDYSWRDLLASHRRRQAEELAARINHIAASRFGWPSAPPALASGPHPGTRQSANPYAAPALIGE